MTYMASLISKQHVIPAKAGIQGDTGFRVKPGMTQLHLRGPQTMTAGQFKGGNKPDAPDGKKDTRPTATKGRILVIEDDPQSLELMAYLLRAFCYTVVTAIDGAEGLDLVGREMFDLIVCDVHLPKFDGYEIARRLKKDPAFRRIPLIAVTALAMVGDRDKVLGAGFDGYLGKPITPELFVKQVEEFMHKRD